MCIEFDALPLFLRYVDVLVKYRLDDLVKIPQELECKKELFSQGHTPVTRTTQHSWVYFIINCFSLQYMNKYAQGLSFFFFSPWNLENDFTLLSVPSRCPPSMCTECCSARRRSWLKWSPQCQTAGSLSRSACAPAESPAPDCSGLWVGLTLLLTLQSWPLVWPPGLDLSPSVCTLKKLALRLNNRSRQ